MRTPQSVPGVGGSLGFTVVELITVLVLLAILSSVALSRMVRPDAFAPATLAHQLKLDLNVALGAATARQDVTTSLALLADADAWVLRVSNDLEGTQRETRVDMLNSSVAVTDGAVAEVVSAVAAFELSFSGAGEVATASIGGAVLDASGGIDLTIVGASSSRDLCLHPTGYLDDSTC